MAVQSFFYVGLGGLIGALLRYSTTLAAARFSIVFPYGTLISNLAGCFIIGAVTGIAAQSEALSPETRLFLATGVCGGFTTLSSFVYEMAQLVRDEELLLASLYFAATFAGAFLFFYLGTLLVNTLLRS